MSHQSFSVPSTVSPAAGIPWQERDIAVDYLRSFVIVLVVFFPCCARLRFLRRVLSAPLH
jgi:hypothetical protein